MKRRSFLKGLAALPATIIAAKAISKPVEATSAFNGAFGLAQVKQEGSAIAYSIIETKEQVAADVFKKAMWPGIQKWYGNNYGL